MIHHPEPANKKFQLDRIALFSDAVFAIAITLLVIEIKVPHMHEHPFSEHQLTAGLGELVPSFIGMFVSFTVIGMYWITHHILFGYVTHYNRKLLWANLLFMLSLILMPFSSAFYSDYWYGPFITPQIWYAGNLLFSSIMNYRLWAIVSDPKNHLSTGLENRKFVHYYMIRSFVPAIVFVLAVLVALINPLWGYPTPLLIPIIFWILKSVYKKKLPSVQ